MDYLVTSGVLGLCDIISKWQNNQRPLAVNMKTWPELNKTVNNILICRIEFINKTLIDPGSSSSTCIVQIKGAGHLISLIKKPLKRHNLFANLFLLSVCPFFCSAFSSPYSYSQVRPLCNMNVVIVVIILVVIGSFGSWLYKSIVTVTSPSGKAPATQMKRENNCMWRKNVF